MALLTGEAIASSHDVLLDVFRDGYADAYVGDAHFSKNFLDRADVAVVDDRHEDINAAALLRNSRITAIATRSDRETFGPRIDNFAGLLRYTHLVDDAAWITIGVDAKQAVRTAAAEAGMTQSCNEGLLRERLERTGRAGSFATSWNGTGLIINLAGSSHGSDYWQEVWGWDTSS